MNDFSVHCMVKDHPWIRKCAIDSVGLVDPIEGVVSIGGIVVLSDEAPSSPELYCKYGEQKFLVDWHIKSDRMKRLHPDSPNSAAARFSVEVPGNPDVLDVWLKGGSREDILIMKVAPNIPRTGDNRYIFYKQDDWEENWSSELDFWRRWMESSGLQWKEEFKRRSSDELSLPDIIEKQLISTGFPVDSNIKILDIGSGPLTAIGSRSTFFRNVEVIPVDPLAEFYNELLERYKVNVPNPTIAGSVEKIGQIFSDKSFDVVWSCNSLDHSYDPIAGLLSILSLVKKNGLAFVVFHPREATHGGFEGLHQWDFFVDAKNDFMIERHRLKINVSKVVARHFETSFVFKGGKDEPKSKIYVIFRKKRDLNVTEMIGLNLSEAHA